MKTTHLAHFARLILAVTAFYFVGSASAQTVTNSVHHHTDAPGLTIILYTHVVGSSLFGADTIEGNGSNVIVEYANMEHSYFDTIDIVHNIIDPVDETEGDEGTEEEDYPAFCETCDCETGTQTVEIDAGQKPEADGSCPNGMAYHIIDPYSLGYRITDRPLPYQPAFGPRVAPVLSYRSRPGAPVFAVSSLGPKWNYNWVRFVEVPFSSVGDVVLSGSKGGRMKFAPFGSRARGLGRNTLVLVSTNPLTYQHRFSGGDVETFSVPGGVTPSGNLRLFLKSFADRAGNTVTFTWLTTPSGVRLTKITDATGKVTTVQYGNAIQPLLITSITDPYGRNVTMGYGANGKLISLTDPAGIVSQFHYKIDADEIDELTTPYGTTHFDTQPLMNGSSRVGTVLTVTDPRNLVSRFERRNLVDAAEFGAEPEPWAGALASRTGSYTLLWKPKASEAPGGVGNIANAIAMQWGVGSKAVVSYKEPTINRQWGTFPNGVAGGITKAASISQVTSVDPVSGQPTVYTVSAGTTTEGLLSWLDDGHGRTIRYAYHPGTKNLHIVMVEGVAGSNPVMLATMTNYNALLRPQTITGVDGTSTTVTYNARGQLKTVTNAKGEMTETFYQEAQAHTDFGRKIGAKFKPGTADEIASSTQYDAHGRVWKFTNHEDETTTIEYDAIGGNPLATLDRVSKVTYPSGQSERVVWNRLDVGESYDIEDKKTTYVHNATRQVTSVTTPDNKTIEYVAGSCCGAVDTLVDAGGKKTHWKYDILGRVTEKWLNWNPSQPGAGGAVRVQLNTYDELGRPVTKTDARGNMRTVVYDEQGRMKDIQYNVAAGTSPTPNVHVVYETQEQSPLGRVVRVESEDGTGYYDSYEYVPIDPSDTVYGDGRVKKASKGSQYSNTYTYDALGRVSATALNVGGQMVGGASHAWDTLGRLTGTTNLLGTEELHYDGATGRVSWTKTVTAGGNLRTDFGYTQNTEHWLASITNTWSGGSNDYTNHTYGYDAVGRLETWKKDVLPSGSGNQWTMGYDASEQLETVAVTGWTRAQPTPVNADFHLYEYDAGGNRTSEQRSGAVRSWTANGFNQLTQQTAGGKMELRGNVNPQSKVTVTPVNTAGTPIGGPIAATAESGATQWKARTNVGAGVRRFSVRAEQTQVPQGLTPEVTTQTLEVNVPAESAVTFSYDADGNMMGNGIWTYKWDAENRLISAKIPASTDGTEVTFSYDAFHRRVKVVETLGATTLSDKLLMWDGLNVVGQRENQTGEMRVFHGNGETRTLNTSTVVLLYTRDHLGSIRELVDAGTGAVRALYDYTPYGIRTKLGGDLDADFGYTGHYTNLRSGLVLAPYRAYSPELGRWISRDPVAERGGINLYGYVDGNPIQWIDPLGRNPVAIAGAAAGGLWGAISGGVSGLATGGFKGMLKGTFSGGVGGALGGFVAGCGNPVAGGMVSGAVSSAISSMLDGDFSVSALAKAGAAAVIGGVTGGIGNKMEIAKQSLTANPGNSTLCESMVGAAAGVGELLSNAAIDIASGLYNAAGNAMGNIRNIQSAKQYADALWSIDPSIPVQ